MVKIILLDLVAVGGGLLMGSLIETPEALLLFMLSSLVLVTALFIRWLKARQRFWEAMKMLQDKP